MIQPLLRHYLQLVQWHCWPWVCQQVSCSWSRQSVSYHLMSYYWPTYVALLRQVSRIVTTICPFQSSSCPALLAFHLASSLAPWPQSRAPSSLCPSLAQTHSVWLGIAFKAIELHFWPHPHELWDSVSPSLSIRLRFSSIQSLSPYLISHRCASSWAISYLSSGHPPAIGHLRARIQRPIFLSLAFLCRGVIAHSDAYTK